MFCKFTVQQVLVAAYVKKGAAQLCQGRVVLFDEAVGPHAELCVIGELAFIIIVSFIALEICRPYRILKSFPVIAEFVRQFPGANPARVP